MTHRSNSSLDRPSVKNVKPMNNLSHRLCVAPMMDWTDRHCRYFLRLISRRARLYTEMITSGALLHGDVPHHLDFDPAEHPLALQLGGSDPVAARPLRENRRALGLRRDQPELRLPVRTGADRKFRRVPDGGACAGRRMRGRDARRDRDSGDGQASNRTRPRRQLRIRPRFRRHGRRGRLRRVHRPRAQRRAEGVVAKGESRGPAAQLRFCASAETRLSCADDRRQRRNRAMGDDRG